MTAIGHKNQEIYPHHLCYTLGQAYTAFEKPVIGGNVSFYNQPPSEGPVSSTPTKNWVSKSRPIKISEKTPYLFGESQSRVVVSVSPEQQAVFEQAHQNKGVNFTQLGKVTTHACHIDEELIHAETRVKKHYDTALEQILD